MADTRKKPPVPSPWLPLASKALSAAIAEDWPTAAKAVESIARTYGSAVVPQLLLALIDTTLKRTAAPTSPSAVAWLEVGSGKVAGADGVPPATRWAGRLMMARASDDEAQFRALIRSVDTDEEWSANCSAVLQMCALNIRRAKEASCG